MKKLLLTLLLLIEINIYSQDKIKDNFTVKVREEEGDLNNDGLTDKIMVSMDTAASVVPLKLEIFFGQQDGKLKPILSSTNIIEPQYPSGKNGKHTVNQISNFSVEDGNLIMISDIKDGQSQHTFRFKNGRFELIHFSKTFWDGKNTTKETDFNLLTGTKTEETKILGSEKPVKKTKSTMKVQALPELQNFKKFGKEFQ
ncbi:hypothetical protein [Chryseobacterium populi]|uniref:Uncharacterized protein n=1 Tax=Chryseobacterium populi TaxID=1144316 RepID=J3CBY6_9FLAO|nr:hypothetical protein [Chryseobacterium populi]EJL68396.1 hypothetical protein PMI13_03731 [Chryseobacterium populi]